MPLRDHQPNEYQELIFHDPKGWSGTPDTPKRGVLYTIEERNGRDLLLARFDQTTGKFIEHVGVSLNGHLGDPEYQGPLTEVIQSEIERVGPAHFAA